MSPRKKATRHVREAHAAHAAEAPVMESSPEAEEGDALLSFDIDPELKELIELAAMHSGQTVSSYAISTLVRDARRIIEDQGTTYLSGRDWEILWDLLDNPPPPNEALIGAMQHYRDLVVSHDKPSEEF